MNLLHILRTPFPRNSSGRLLLNILYLSIFKNDLQVLLYKTLIFIQTNIYVKTYTSMQIFRCCQDKTMVSDSFKRNLYRFNMEKVEHENFFILKWKRLNHHHLKMIILIESCILALTNRSNSSFCIFSLIFQTNS